MTKQNALLIFAAVTLTVVIVAAVIVRQQAPQTELPREPLLPGLSARINDAAEIAIESRRDRTILRRSGDAWVIANADGYPALFDRVRALLISLSELKTLERKTRNPALYHRLGVEDPGAEGSQSLRVIVRDSGGGVLADLIIGKPRLSRITNQPTGLYVRMPDAAQALLVEGGLEIAADKTAWFDADILNIPATRVREVVIRHPNGETLVVSRTDPADADFILEGLPPDRRLKSQVTVNRLGSVLQDVRASDARARAGFNFPEDATQVTVRTLDGLVATVRTARVGGASYAQFDFDAGPAPEPPAAGGSEAQAGPTAAEEAAAINQRLGRWVYLIPEFKYEILTETLDNLTLPAPG
jgi:hypothetical protein